MVENIIILWNQLETMLRNLHFFNHVGSECSGLFPRGMHFISAVFSQPNYCLHENDKNTEKNI